MQPLLSSTPMPAITGGRPEAPLTLEHVRHRDALDALAPEWRRLLDDSALNSIFLTWEWQGAWLDHYLAPQDEPWVLVLREGGRLIGIAPLLRQVQRRRGRPSLRRIRFLGTGEPEAEEVVSEMLDIICLPGREAAVAVAVARHLLEHASEWDILYFQDIREDSLIRQRLLPRLREADLRAAEESDWVNYWINLPPSLKEYVSSLPQKRRYQFNRALRQYGEHQGKFQLLSDPADLDQYYRELMRLHRARWQVLNGPGIFTTARVEAFHAQVLREMLAAEQLQLSLLSVEGNAVSAHYVFCYKGVPQSYQMGFDPQFDRVRSVGTLHFLLCFDHNIRAGCQAFDILKSRAWDKSYKRFFGCVAAPLYDLTVFNRNVGGQLLWLEHGLRQQFRRVMERFNKRREKSAPDVAEET